MDARQLDVDGQRELRAHTRTWDHRGIGQGILQERVRLWRGFYSLDRRRGIRILARWLKPFADRTICFLGVGTGREVEYLLHFVSLSRVWCSDLSASNLWAVRPRLAPYSVDVPHLFTADLNHCPVTDRALPIVMVGCLHHTADMHETLSLYLRDGYHHLFLLEPVENWLTSRLARLGWARRTEYSGVEPGRLDLKVFRAQCKAYGYDLHVRTFWSFPADYFQRLGIESRMATLAFVWLVDVFSVLTRPIRFGNMCVAYLRRVP